MKFVPFNTVDSNKKFFVDFKLTVSSSVGIKHTVFDEFKLIITFPHFDLILSMNGQLKGSQLGTFCP